MFTKNIRILFLSIVLFLVSLSFADYLALLPYKDNDDLNVILRTEGVSVISLFKDKALLYLDDEYDSSFLEEIEILDANAEDYEYWSVYTVSDMAYTEYINNFRVIYDIEAEYGHQLIFALPEGFDKTHISVDGVFGIRPIRKDEIKIPSTDEGSYIPVPDADPDIQTLVDQIDQDSFLDYDQTLEDFVTRNTFTDENLDAIDWIEDQFQSFGLPTQLHQFIIYNYQRYNCIAEQVGQVNPDNIYIIIGHMDSTAGNPWYAEPNAPGADDNASGTSAVIEVARVLSQYEFENTIRYVCVSGEEQGLYGSYYYAEHCYNNGDNILGVINLDMIMYAPPQYDSLSAYYDDQSETFALNYEDYAETYAPDLDVQAIYDPSVQYSDHYYFWYFGYPAFCGIEEGVWYNPYYHTTQDLQANYLEYLPFPTLVVKGSCGALATFAVLHGDIPVEITDFRAESVQDGIRLIWECDYKGEDIMGFNIYRQRSDGFTNSYQNQLISENTLKINDVMITGKNPFVFVDTKAERDVEYVYMLKPVYSYGETDKVLAKTRGSFNGPLAFELSNVYPNPADEDIHIEYNVPESMKNSSISIVLYDLAGRKVYKVSGIQPITGANEHTISLQDTNSPITNGLYILRIATDNYESISEKVVVCK